MCSRTGLRDFPIVNSVPVTPSLNGSIYEEIPLDIQWGPKATPPSFIEDTPLQGLGFLAYGGSDTSSTTLRLNGSSFRLQSVQLCTPQHRTFLPLQKQRDASGELILAFKTDTPIGESYVLLCVPILMGATASPSVYLEALRQDHLDGKPTSLLSCLPSDPHFISYSTCLQRREAQSTSVKTVRVFVFTEGLVYPSANFSQIVSKLVPRGTAVPRTVTLPTIQLPDGLVDKSEAMLYSLTTEVDYKTFLRYSLYYPSGREDTSKRTDRLDSYKCVPLEPSKNIKDGQIVVDTESGELLSQVVKEEEVGTASTSSLSPALIEKLVAIAVGLVLLAFVLLVIAYIVTNLVTPNADSFFGVVKQRTMAAAPVLVVSFIVGVTCFILGLLLREMAS